MMQTGEIIAWVLLLGTLLIALAIFLQGATDSIPFFTLVFAAVMSYLCLNGFASGSK